MKIITVVGKSNCGKSTLIKYLFENLLQMGAKVIFYKLKGAHFEDFISIIAHEEKIIGICSLGDKTPKSDKYFETPTDYIDECYEDLFSQFTNNFFDYFINVKNTNIDESLFNPLLKRYCNVDSYIPIKMKYCKDDGFTSIQIIQEKYKEIIEQLDERTMN